ncbi:hypothetical protein [Sphingobacterium kitahiroshimense]|uniref:Uncharacterized protein n=1 Tax=Sphingobacterium kitahiroshimense TaxID=470446 RepID=A0ABV0BT22_9SPHI
MNVIEGNEYGASTGGRRAVQYKMNNSFMIYTLVITLDQYYTALDIFDLENKCVADNVDIDNPLHNEDQILEVMVHLIEDIILSSITAVSNFRGIKKIIISPVCNE